MKQSSKVALGGIFSALALVCMMLTVIPALEFSLPALAGVVLIPVVLELGVPWGWLSYVCVGILSLLIAPNMEAKVLFVAFFDSLGYVVVGMLLCGIIMWLIGKRNIVELLLVSILVPLGMWLVFYKMLSVNIPMGVLQPLRDLVDMIHF